MICSASELHNNILAVIVKPNHHIGSIVFRIDNALYRLNKGNSGWHIIPGSSIDVIVKTPVSTKDLTKYLRRGKEL